MVRLRRSAVALAAAVLALNVAPSAAAPAEADVFQTQIRLIVAADQIKAAGGDGYAGISVAVDRGELVLRWKGALPTPVANAVAAARRDVGVRVLPSAHTEQELVAMAHRLAKEPGVTSAGPKSDGSGLRLGFAGDSSRARALPAIRDAGVPVEVQREEPVLATSQPGPWYPCTIVQQVWRQNDHCPHKGGAWYLPSGCSTGWPVYREYWTIGVVERYLLTAAHCGVNGSVVHDGGGETIGTMQEDNDNRDTVLVAAWTAPSVYVGGWNSNVIKPIRMPIDNYPNTLVCTSGAMSGQHCDLRVESVNQVVNLHNPATGQVYPVYPMVIAAGATGTVAVAGGDSGGPVAAQDSSTIAGGGIVHVYAAGTITAGSDRVACPVGSTASRNAVCYSRVYYAPLLASLSYYGVSLAVSGS